MVSTAPRPLDRLAMWVLGSAWAAYQQRRQLKRSLKAKAVRKARKEQRRAKRKLARALRAKQEVRKSTPSPQPSAVRGQAAQLVLAQKAIATLRRNRQAMRQPRSLQQAGWQRVS